LFPIALLLLKYDLFMCKRKFLFVEVIFLHLIKKLLKPDIIVLIRIILYNSIIHNVFHHIIEI